MGEGYDHDYYVLRAGDRLLRTGHPLTPAECFDMLSRLDPRYTYVGFALNYDFTMILRKLPTDIIGKLLHRNSRAFTDDRGFTSHAPVLWEGYRIDYMPHKRLSVGYEGYPMVEIHDVFRFFQSSFLVAIERWGVCTPEEYATIKAGKERRSDANVLDDAAEAYNKLECEVLARLMTEFDKTCRRVGMSAWPYEGPGALAASAYSTYVQQPHRRRKEEGKPPQPPAEMPAIDAYYGGRFETTAIGPIGAYVHEYDIISAYPHAQSQLPCVWHSRWIHEDLGEKAKVRLGRVEWRYRGDPRHANLAPFPVRRTDGSVTFPRSGRGRYWSYEWAQPIDGYDIEVDDVWSLTPDCDCKPYAWIRSLFEARKNYKARGEAGPTYVLKYAYNSLYGKLAQSIGTAPWQHLAYAGMITSMCRATIYKAAMQAPDDILMIATDGIYSLQPLVLDIGTELGQWESTIYDDMCIVRPGIYFTPDGLKTKTRGVSADAVMKREADIIAAFERGVDAYVDHGRSHGKHGPDGRCTDECWGVTVDFNGLISLKLAHSQNRPEKAGYFGVQPYSLNYDPAPKRVRPQFRGTCLRTDPPDESSPFESVPYKARFSEADESDDVTVSAPDRIASGVTVL